MLINQSASGSALRASGLAYWELLKPRVTILLTFLGAAAAVVASGADPAQSGTVALITLAVFLGSGGSNGLTNYLDRALDARMNRTRGRSIPSGRIVPAGRALYWSAAWVIAGALLALLVHPLAALAGLTGTLAAVSFRKTEATHFLGGVSSASPVAVGWLAMDPSFGPVIGLLCAFVGVWVIHHVWAIMLFYRADYLQAGVAIFPLRAAWNSARPLFLFLAAALVILVAAMGLVADQGPVYWVMAGAFSLYNVWGTTQLEKPSLSPAVQRRRFKTASYSLLCGVFTALIITTALTAT